ncbi:MAG: alpha/beta hydrolase [Candidatus Peregrinibacteria bacterium]
MTHVLLCLHGWGGSKESFADLRAALEGSGIEILTPDLPGFGSEPEPPKPWSVDDYADWVEQWMTKQQATFPFPLSPFHLLGHSHGGRIAIKLANRQSANRQSPIARLFLCASAGIPHRTFKVQWMNVLAKIGRTLFALPLLKKLEQPLRKILYKILGVHDYERASPMMKATMQRVTSEDLTPLLSNIRIPTDLFWGENDTQTPISDGKRMHDMIRGSILHTFAGTRHRVHRDRAMEIASVIRERMETD